MIYLLAQSPRIEKVIQSWRKPNLGHPLHPQGQWVLPRAGPAHLSRDHRIFVNHPAKSSTPPACTGQPKYTPSNLTDPAAGRRPQDAARGSHEVTGGQARPCLRLPWRLQLPCAAERREAETLWRVDKHQISCLSTSPGGLNTSPSSLRPASSGSVDHRQV